MTALLAMLTSFGTADVSAQSELFMDSKPYVSLLLTGSTTVDGPKPTSVDIDPTLGLGLAPAIGYRWLPLRVELEYHILSSAILPITDLVTITALTANAILEWQVTQPVGVYVGAGYGQAKVRDDSGTHATSGFGNAGQLQIGVTFGSPNRFQLLLGYRRFATGSLGLADAQGRPFEVDKVRMSTAQIGIRSNF